MSSIVSEVVDSETNNIDSMKHMKTSIENTDGRDENSETTVTNSDGSSSHIEGDTSSEASEKDGGVEINNTKSNDAESPERKRKRKLSLKSQPFIPSAQHVQTSNNANDHNVTSSSGSPSPVKIHVDIDAANATVEEFEQNIQNRVFHLSLLFANSLAGSIIGVKGSTIVKIQKETKAKVKLSQVHEVYPGTNDRIVLYRGRIFEIIYALALSIEKIVEEHSNILMPQKKLVLKMIVPSVSVGALIGIGGETVRNIVKIAGCKVKISPKETVIPYLSERIIQIMGNPSQCLVAIALLLEKLNKSETFATYKSPAANFFNIGGNDAHPINNLMPNEMVAVNAMYGTSPPAFVDQFCYYQTYSPTGLQYAPPFGITNYGAIPGVAINANSNATEEDYVVDNQDAFNQGSEEQYSATMGDAEMVSDIISVDIEISKQFAGALLGPRGETIVKLQRESGTTIRMSPNDPKLKHRNIHIIGTEYGCSTARFLIREVLDQKKKEFFQDGLYKNTGKSRRGSRNKKKKNKQAKKKKA